jgi:voltage-gated potassium channel
MFKFLQEGFNNHRSKQFVPVHIFLTAVTVIAVASLILEDFSSLGTYSSIFLTIEWATVIMFTFEYLARIVTARKKLTYVFSFWGLLDLVSILPTFLGLGDWAFLKSLRVIRFFKIMRSLHVSNIPEDYS